MPSITSDSTDIVSRMDLLVGFRMRRVPVELLKGAISLIIRAQCLHTHLLYTQITPARQQKVLAFF